MGKLFVIDGTDGSGKQTQFEKLKENLDIRGIKYKTVSFPNYDSPSSSLVKMYLSGEFGKDPKDVSAYVASTFYAADRYATYKKDFEEFYKAGGIILADRYTTANMVHQAGKISDENEREKFIKWLFDLEFNIYGIPKPDLVFFLNMPPKNSMELIKNRENKFTHNTEKDIHERDKNHLIDSYNAACSLVDKYGWTEIKCIENNKIREIESISDEIINYVLKELGE
ncbi:MAG: deoxynucleoside kinase [Clostridia bacterium]|nr:deoxynucleoside kinase [Clostridia bacterium]